MKHKPCRKVNVLLCLKKRKCGAFMRPEIVVLFSHQILKIDIEYTAPATNAYLITHHPQPFSGWYDA